LKGLIRGKGNMEGSESCRQQASNGKWRPVVVLKINSWLGFQVAMKFDVKGVARTTKFNGGG
jgi:hypothetical protein